MTNHPVTPERAPSHRRRTVCRTRLWLIGALALVVAITGCTGTAPTNPNGSPTPAATPTAVARPLDFVAPPVPSGLKLGDRTDQGLSAVAASASTVVAVGWDNSDGVGRPLFLSSTDAGLNWSRTGLDASSQAAATTDEAADLVAAGPAGFVALGASQDSPQAWTSADARSWHRVTMPSGVFSSHDSVAALIHTPGGFLAAGTEDLPSGAALARVVTWTSTDGLHWARHDLSRLGVRFPGGTPRVAGAAVHGSTVVIAGGIEDNTNTKQPDRLALWRSGDAGAHWAQVSTRQDLAGDYRAYAQDLVFEDNTFSLVAHGDGSSTNGSWDGVVVSGDASGTHWSTTAKPVGWGSAADEYPAGTVRTDDAWVTYGSIGQKPSDARITVGASLDVAHPLTEPSLGGDGDQSAVDATVAGAGVVVVGTSDASGSTTPIVWRVTGQRIARIALPPTATAGRPTVDLTDVVADGSGYLAAGDVADSAAVWSSGDGRRWSATQLPGRSTSIGSASVGAVTVTTSGTAVVAGDLYPARGSRVAVWLKAPSDSTWRSINSPTFVSPVEDDYGFYRVSTLAGGLGGVVLAGTHVADGHQDLALWFSEDGTTWQHGSATRTTTLSADDRDDNRSPYPAFRAPDNGSVDIYAVAAVGQGFVAAGAITEGGRERPVVWRSADGRVWRDPVALPTAPGAWSVGASNVVVDGQRVIVTGYVSASASATEYGAVSWVSSDGGRDWTVGSSIPGPVGIYGVQTVPGGYLAIGRTGRFAVRDVGAWTSRDGRAWKRVDLGLPRGAGPGVQQISAVVPGRKQLLVVASDVQPTGGGYYSTWVPLPRP